MSNVANSRFVIDAYRRAADLKEVIARLEADLATETAYLIASVGNETGKHTVTSGDESVTFTVSENNRYDTAAMLAVLKPGQVSRVSIRKVDNSLVKRLYPDVHAAAKVTNGLKVSL